MPLLNASVPAEIYLAPAPDPPVFYFINREENNIPVYVNDSQVLVSSTADHIVPQARKVT